MAGLRAGLRTLFAEREIFLRSGGQVKFLRISSRAQIIAATGLGTVLLLWAGATIAMVVNQTAVARSQAELSAKSAAVADSAGKVNSYRKSVGDLAKDLKARQDFMDELYKSHFGGENDAEAVIGKPQAEDKASPRPENSKISALPEARPLLRLEERQRLFARLLTGAVERRTQQAEAAIRGFGLDPRTLARRAAVGQGGPFVPWRGDRDGLTDELKGLSSALTRLDILERSLVAIPSGQPTATPMLSSSYGYRSDPFTGHAAFHAGLDFPGSMGQPILAAARGRVSYVGPRQGYGNVVEIDHGNGLMTRYAHLSRFGTRVGATVARGDAIARMGSTGRSTGPHLHFEVRQNGAPINPRRFLEARKDVLQIQQSAKDRFADVGNRG